MKDKIRFGLIGCGRISSRHVQSIIDLENTELVAVADNKTDRANYYANKYSIDSYHDYRYMLDRSDIDVINICTPSGLHAQMTIEAFQTGKNVICEKPMALNLKDANRMIDTADYFEKKLSIALQNRFNPPMIEMQKVINNGKLGKILLGNATLRWFRSPKYYQDEWHGTKLLDGGTLLNQAIHHIDALQWMMGMPKSVFSYTATLAHDIEIEDIGVAVLKFPNESLATIECSTVTYPENLEASLTVFGEKGSIKVGGTALNQKEIWKIKDELENESPILQQIETNIYGKSHKKVVEDMVSSIINNKEPQINGKEGRNSIIIASALYESANKAKEINLDYYQILEKSQ